VACAVAACVFVAWEAFTKFKYNDSHFLLALRSSHTTLMEKLSQVGPLPLLLGGVAPPVAALGLVALRLPRIAVAGFAALVFAGYAIIAKFASPAESNWDVSEHSPHFSVTATTFIVLGTLSAAIVVTVVVSSVLRFRRRPVRLSPVNWFLVLW